MVCILNISENIPTTMSDNDNMKYRHKEGHNLIIPLIPCFKKQKSYSSPSDAVLCHHVYYGLKVFNACMETGGHLSKKCSGCICCSSCFFLLVLVLETS